MPRLPCTRARVASLRLSHHHSHIYTARQDNSERTQTIVSIRSSRPHHLNGRRCFTDKDPIPESKMGASRRESLKSAMLWLDDGVGCRVGCKRRTGACHAEKMITITRYDDYRIVHFTNDDRGPFSALMSCGHFCRGNTEGGKNGPLVFEVNCHACAKSQTSCEICVVGKRRSC